MSCTCAENYCATCKYFYQEYVVATAYDSGWCTSTPDKIRTHAFKLAELLLRGCKQLWVSVVLPDETVMFSATEDK
jgi:hypothetical protein